MGLQGAWPIRQAVVWGVLLTFSGSALPWTYPEHRDITALAVEGLAPETREVLDTLWEEARTDHESRLCLRALEEDSARTLAPSCIDWVSLPAIAADHSCSSTETLEAVLTSDWVLKIAAIGAQLKADLAVIPEPRDGVLAPDGSVGRERLADESAAAQRSNAVRAATLREQAADPGLATRASMNFAHFMLARPDTSLDPDAYAEATLRSGSPLNALGAYAWFHLSALEKANRLGKAALSAEQRRTLARSVLFDEAFALHFLEDSFAAGHVAGSWGDVARRKGTHDYYNEHGLEVFTWQDRGSTVVLMGDAYLRPQNAELVAQAVRTSLEQVVEAAAGRSRGYELPEEPTLSDRTDDFDVCTNIVFPEREDEKSLDTGARAAFREVLLQTPVPSLGAGPGEVPRFLSEIGAFVGLGASIDASVLDGGFVNSQTATGYASSLDVSLRGGIGLEGALGDSSDGLVFASIGFRGSSNSTNKSAAEGPTLDGSLSSAIPARTGISLRFRVPFYVVPGDLILASPLYLINPEKYMNMAVTASNGGLIPWQVGMQNRLGRFQFVIGREIGLTFFGRRRTDQLLVPSEIPGEIGQVVDYESLAIDLPIAEFRPFRTFSSDQSSSLLFQLFAGADIPNHERVAYPAGAAAPNLDTVWSVGLRMVFDWRHYRHSR